MPTIGAGELIIILVIVLIVFGSSRLPKLARSIGQASKEFRRGVDEAEASADEAGEPGEDDRGDADEEQAGGRKAQKAQRKKKS